MKIKVCGLTRAQDIEAVNALGVWAVGLNAYPYSPRYLTPKKMAELAALLTPGILKVGVFVNASAEHIHSVARTCQLDFVQLHGDESAEFCSALGLPIIKAFRLKPGAPAPYLNAYAPYVSYFLLDSFSTEAYGGTGERITTQALAAVENSPRPILLAGGVNPNNALFLWQTQQPFALDICSGVESQPGIKDHEKLRQLKALALDAHD